MLHLSRRRLVCGIFHSDAQRALKYMYADQLLANIVHISGPISINTVHLSWLVKYLDKILMSVTIASKVCSVLVLKIQDLNSSPCAQTDHIFFFPCLEPTLKVLKMSLTEFSLPKFYQLFGISKVKSAAVSAFRTSYRPGDRSFTMSPLEHDKMSLCSLEVITDALLEIMEVSGCP